MPDHYKINTLILVGHNIPDKDDIVFQQFKTMAIKDRSLCHYSEKQNAIFMRERKCPLNSLIEKGLQLKSQFMR
jgi:hypothetical protein